MEIQHTAKDFDLTDSIRDHAEEKMGKACAQLAGVGACRMHLTYRTEGHSKHGANQAVHVLLTVPHGEPLQAEEVADGLYAAIDAAAKDIERQVHKYRDRLASKRA